MTEGEKRGEVEWEERRRQDGREKMRQREKGGGRPMVMYAIRKLLTTNGPPSWRGNGGEVQHS